MKMLYLRRGRTPLRVSLTENALFRRSYVPSYHKEPKDLSWQWSVRKTPELMGCKNLCVSKICPKPSFFPRFKKIFIPADEKACETKKPPMSWKEYWSFLLPNPGTKPPLIKCRKLQAKRRKCCGNPMDCTENCLTVNCCPPPKEWYGQAEIFAVPSSLPPRVKLIPEPQPCVPSSPAEHDCVLALKGICPPTKKSLNMDEYAYRKAFSGTHLCDEVRKLPTSFRCKSACVPQFPGSDKNLRLYCGFFTEFKDVECPIAISNKTASYELPPLICPKKPIGTGYKKEINVEVKKGVCGRTTFLKPYKYGEKLPGVSNSCKFHTNTYKTKLQLGLQRKLLHSTSQLENSKGNDGVQHTEDVMANKLEEVGFPSCLQKGSYSQPAKSGVGLHYMLMKPLAGRVRDGLYSPPEPYHSSEEINSYCNSQEIDPELTKLAEETKKNMSYGVPTIKKDKNTPNTLVKQLSKATEEKILKRAKQKGERPITPKQTPHQQSKLSLLSKRKKTNIVSCATFMTETKFNVKYAKKKSDKSKKDIICEGCLGIKAAEKELKHPSPKSFINCKERPAGRCRGPQRKVYPDEGEPTNPYYKSKQKPYSICNKQRPIIKKEERPYKMPCEDRNSGDKREFHSSTTQITFETKNINASDKKKIHSSTCLLETESNIPTLYDIIKVRGLTKSIKQPHNHSNDWDSHTSDSYGERIYEEYDSLPDLSKYQPKNEDTTIKKMSYPINLWENPENKKKPSYNTWPNNDGNNSSKGVHRVESQNQVFTFKKRTPPTSPNKESNNSIPSKYNMLFNPTSIKKQAESSDQNPHNLTYKATNQDKMYYDKKMANLKPENKKHNKPKLKELPTCPITTQNMWGDSQHSSSEQNLPSNELVFQEMKSMDRPTSHNLFNNSSINDSSAHDMFQSKEEPNKVLPKKENEKQTMVYKEKMSNLSDSGELDNMTTISGNKSE